MAGVGGLCVPETLYRAGPARTPRENPGPGKGSGLGFARTGHRVRDMAAGSASETIRWRNRATLHRRIAALSDRADHGSPVCRYAGMPQRPVAALQHRAIASLAHRRIASMAHGWTARLMHRLAVVLQHCPFAQTLQRLQREKPHCRTAQCADWRVAGLYQGRMIAPPRPLDAARRNAITRQ